MRPMRYVNWLRWGIIGGLFLIPFVPFVISDVGSTIQHGFYLPFSNLFFPFIVGKNLFFRVIVELIFGLYVLLALREPKYRPHPSLLLYAVGAFVVWMGLATFFSVDLVKSFWSNFERMDGYITVLHVAALFVIAATVLTVDKLWYRFFHTTVAASALMGIDALLQLTHAIPISSQSGARIDTTFGNAIYVAVYMLFHMFLSLYLMLRERGLLVQVYLGIVWVLQFVALFFSGTRGAFLGVVGGHILVALYIVVFAPRKEYAVLRTVSMGFLGLMVVIAGAFFALKDSAFVKQSNTLNRIASISLTDTTTMSRFTLWRDMAIPGAMERPVFGWGQENFNFVFNKYYTPNMYGQEAWFDRTHNEFLDWFVAGGVVPFLLYIAFFGLAAAAVWRSSLSVPEQAVFMGVLAAYAFNNMTVFHDLMSFALFFLVLAFCHSLSERHHPRLWLSKPVGDHGLAIAAPLVGLVTLYVLWGVNMPAYARGTSLVHAIQSQQGVTNAQGQVVAAPKDPRTNLAEFAQALAGTWPYAPIGRQEATEQMLTYAANSVAPSSTASPQLKQEFLSAAYDAGTKLLVDRPGDARLELFFATFLAQVGRIDESIAHLQAALALSPQKQQILMQLGTTYLQAGNRDAALATLKKAYDLEPRYETARIIYAGGLYVAGQTAAADALITEGFGATIVDNDQLLQVYTNAKLYDRVIAIRKLRVDQDPKNFEKHFSLAQAYFAAGKKAETIAELKMVAQLRPDMAASMQQIIGQIESGALKPGQ
jgi:tetratricopeptide (TPR) repeat protein/O-antigen ligase